MSILKMKYKWGDQCCSFFCLEPQFYYRTGDYLFIYRIDQKQEERQLCFKS